MTLVWVTGISGSGKSAVCKDLKAKGHRAIDADWEGYNYWVDRTTGEVVVDPPYPAPPRWLERFAWEISIEAVESLAATALGATFLCGYAENESDVLSHFDEIVCLVIDDETLRHRLSARATNAFGKHPDELAIAVARNQAMKAEYRKKGARLVDATRPLDAVVRDILATAHRSTCS